MRAWIDGVASPEAAVSVLDETFLRGDGCFEALRSYGGRLFDVESHLNRLERSARALEMAMPLRRDLVEWLNVAGAEGGDCVVRLVLTRGPASGLGSAIIIVQPVPDRPAAYRLATVEAPWHPAGRSWDLAGVKSVSYAPNMAASRRATHAGAHDALLVSGGTILEGPTFSVGWIVDGVLETPTLDLGILASVTRKHALLVAADVGLPVAEGTWPASRLEDASEVMVWSTTKEIAPVDGIDELRYEPGPVTEMLAKEFGGVVSR